MIDLEKNVFEIENNFEKLTLQIFEYQYNNCEIYNKYVNLLNRKSVNSLFDIPFLPISFFKSHNVLTKDSFEAEFLSSGTGNSSRSSHKVYKLSVYEKSFDKHYRTCIGNPENQIIFALLPSYIEQGNSSLVYMLNNLIEKSKHKYSGFYLHENDLLLERIIEAKKENKEIILFGVTYALLDLAEMKPDLSSVKIIETGGMKGRREEISKQALHEILKKSFNVKYIYSEYGMTELLSQSYSIENELFISAPWKKILIRNINDPFNYEKDGKTGAINVIDLANIYSCSFIETEDLGKIVDDKFQVLGRLDTSETRGCNLLYR